MAGTTYEERLTLNLNLEVGQLAFSCFEFGLEGGEGAVAAAVEHGKHHTFEDVAVRPIQSLMEPAGDVGRVVAELKPCGHGNAPEPATVRCAGS